MLPGKCLMDMKGHSTRVVFSRRHYCPGYQVHRKFITAPNHLWQVLTSVSFPITTWGERCTGNPAEMRYMVTPGKWSDRNRTMACQILPVWYLVLQYVIINAIGTEGESCNLKKILVLNPSPLKITNIFHKPLHNCQKTVFHMVAMIDNP